MGFVHISSPMPRPEFRNRVIANDLPMKTYSPTTFDLPQRKDVIQAQMPTMVTRTIEAKTDPRYPPKKPVPVLNASFVHGTGSPDENVVINFAEKTANKSKKKACHKKNKNGKRDVSCVKAQANIALNRAKDAYDQSSAVLDSITHNLAHGKDDKMILDIQLMNKKENLDFNLHEKNYSREKRMRDLRRTPAGVRALHTPRKLPY